VSKPEHSLRPFPQAWFTPTAEAREALCMIAEGFCPFITGPGLDQWPLDAEGRCSHCGARWELVARRDDGQPAGFSATWGSHPYTSMLAVYPFSEERAWASFFGKVTPDWLGYGRPT
jgi:hypothetical protein